MEQPFAPDNKFSSDPALRKMVRSTTSRLISSLIQRFGTQFTADIEESVHAAFSEVRAAKKDTALQEDAVSDIQFENLFGNIAPFTGDGNSLIPPASVTVTGAPSLKNLFLLSLCCYAPLSRRESVFLCANLAGGFSHAEIADGLGIQEEIVSLTIKNALNHIRVDGPSTNPPSVHQLPVLIDRALRSLRKLFSLAYYSPLSHPGLSEEICESSRDVLALLPDTGISPVNPHAASVYAALAEMYFLSARFPARIDTNGTFVGVDLQNRSLWKTEAIEKGRAFLEIALRSIAPDTYSIYHYLALVSYFHTSADSYGETNWIEILDTYQHLLKIESRPTWLLQRARCIGELEGPEAGLRTLALIPQNPNIFIWPSAIAELYAKQGDHARAMEYFRRAHKLVPPGAMKNHFYGRLQDCLALQRN